MTRPLWGRWDAVVVGVLLVLNLAAFGFPYRGKPAEGVEILSEGGRRVVPFGAGRIEVPGPLGVTVVEVGRASVRVAASPCPRQICVRAGPVRRPGGVSVCLPNRVAVRVLGMPGEGVDAVGR